MLSTGPTTTNKSRGTIDARARVALAGLLTILGMIFTYPHTHGVGLRQEMEEIKWNYRIKSNRTAHNSFLFI